MSQIIAQLEALAASPPADAAERQALYSAIKKLSTAIEDPYDTIYRVIGSPKILTFSEVASDLGIYQRLAESEAPLTGASLATSTKADPVLMSRILRFLASNDLIAETGEDTFAANSVTKTLARPGFRAGIAHAFYAIAPCLQATPKFLAETKYMNPADVLHSPFQVAHNTDKPAFLWAMEQPKLMADFNLWMSELHDGQSTWLDKFDFAGHVHDASNDTLIFVDVGGGIGQQCALLKKVHPHLPGRVVLQEQSFVVPHAIPVEGVEKEAYDFWTEQPLKGSRVYYLRNILHDYPDEKALQIIQNTAPAMSSGSLLIIDEMVIPNREAHMRATELDMTMMTSLASIERTEKQWDALIDRAGLKILEKATYNPATGESVIVTVPK